MGRESRAGGGGRLNGTSSSSSHSLPSHSLSSSLSKLCNKTVRMAGSKYHYLIILLLFAGSLKQRRPETRYTCCAGPIISPAKPVSSCSSHPSRSCEPSSPAPRPPRCLAPEKKGLTKSIIYVQALSIYGAFGKTFTPSLFDKLAKFVWGESRTQGF